MDAIQETTKRLDIARQISSSLEKNVKQIILGGSMGFAQNYSIRPESDIDLVVVVDKECVDELETSWFYKGEIPSEVRALFETGAINLFCTTRVINGVEVNVFTYQAQEYTDFCLLRGELRGFTKKKPIEIQKAYTFDGTEVTFSRNVKPNKGGFLYQKPCFVQGRFWAGVPRQDFLYSAIVLCGEDFFNELEKKVWESMTRQLVKEHGNDLDLSKTNILNTHYVYQNARERLPSIVLAKIKERTEKEMVALIGHKPS